MRQQYGLQILLVKYEHQQFSFPILVFKVTEKKFLVLCRHVVKDNIHKLVFKRKF